MLRINDLLDAQIACNMFVTLCRLGIIEGPTKMKLGPKPYLTYFVFSKYYKKLVNEVQLRLMKKELEREAEAPTQR